MATVVILTPGVSPAVRSNANRRLTFAKNFHESVQTVYQFTNSPRQHHAQKSVIPLIVKSIKISKHISKPVSSPNCSIFQTCLTSNSKFRTKIVGALDIKNTEISTAPEIGVAVFILKDNKILMGRRRSLSIAANIYALPGGHVEFGESYEECASREVKEETGLDIKNIELLKITNNYLSNGVHLVIIYMRANLSDPNQIPQNNEPSKCEGWEWYDLNNLPEPMFEPLRELLQGGFSPLHVVVST